MTVNLNVTQRPIVLNRGGGGTDVYAQQQLDHARGRGAVYGLTDPAQVAGFASDGLELLFAQGYYRRAYGRGSAPSSLGGWSFARGSVAWAQTAPGVISEFAADAPRIVEGRGLLVERARTNLAHHSNDLSNAAWTKEGLAAGAPGGSGPLGAYVVLTVDAGGGSHWVYQSVAAGIHTHSVIARAGTAGWIAISGGNSGVSGAFFDLVTGAVGTVRSDATARIEPLGGGWYRCSVTFSAGVSFLTLEPHTADAQIPAWTAAGTETVEIAHGQVEVGGWATSPIVTTSSSVTRAADLGVVGGLPYAAPVTVLAAWSGTATGAGRTIHELSDAAGDRLTSWVNPTLGQVVSAAYINHAGQTGQIIPTAQPAGRLATSWGGGAIRSSLDGAAAVETPTSLPAARLDTLAVGHFSGTSHLDGWVSALVVMPFAVSDDLLVEMSA